MKRSLITMLAVFSMLALGSQAQALFIHPGQTPQFNGVTHPTGPKNLIPPRLEDLDFQFAPLKNGSGGTISNILGDPNYLLVKNADYRPWWYLFQLPTMDYDTIFLSGFWVDKGALSHDNLNLFGTSGTAPVPEPGTLLLLGSGLLGLALYGRKRIKG